MASICYELLQICMFFLNSQNVPAISSKNVWNNLLMYTDSVVIFLFINSRLMQQFPKRQNTHKVPPGRHSPPVFQHPSDPVHNPSRRQFNASLNSIENLQCKIFGLLSFVKAKEDLEMASTHNHHRKIREEGPTNRVNLEYRHNRATKLQEVPRQAIRPCTITKPSSKYYQPASLQGQRKAEGKSRSRSRSPYGQLEQHYRETPSKIKKGQNKPSLTINTDHISQQSPAYEKQGNIIRIDTFSIGEQSPKFESFEQKGVLAKLDQLRHQLSQQRMKSSQSQQISPYRSDFELKVYPCDLNRNNIKAYIANKLSELIQIDMEYEELKNKFLSLPFSDAEKKKKLTDCLWSRGLMIDQIQTYSYLGLNPSSYLHINSQEVANSKIEPLIQSLVNKFLQAEFYWQKKLTKILTEHEFNNCFFNPRELDLQKKGYLKLEDVTCFVNLNATNSAGFRNKNVLPLFLRFTRVQDSQQCLSFNNFVDKLFHTNDGAY